MALSPEAKAELDAAIAIVRQDKAHEYIRNASKAATATPPAVPPTPPANPPLVVPAPPAKPPVVEPPKPPKRHAYWGELLDS